MSDAPVLRRVTTASGPARVHLTAAGHAAGTLVLGHGAGGGVDAVDLRAAAAAATALGWAVALVEQPWRVAGRRVAEAPSRLDAAWTAVVERLPVARPLVLGGRSAGARVACRTAAALSADAVLALAFPLVAPGGRTREEELRAPVVPRLVVQGARDGFGVPEPAPGVAVHVVAGADHAFAVRRRDGRTGGQVADELRDVVGGWLQTLT
jgi:predicted alpha/beta-hydrolase family hydrolase